MDGLSAWARIGGPRRVVRAGLLAGVLSGAPSTAWALATGGDPLAAARAAGTLLPGRRDRPGLVAGALAHAMVSAVWTAAIAGGLAARPPRTRGGAVAAGTAAGLGIAALDLGLLARAFPAVRALALGPQIADHLAFGALVGAGLTGAPPAPTGRHGSLAG